MLISLPAVTRTVVLAAGLGAAALGVAGEAAADTGQAPAQLADQATVQVADHDTDFASPVGGRYCVPGSAINCRTGRVPLPVLQQWQRHHSTTL